MHNPHSFTSAAGSWFDDDWVAGFVGRSIAALRSVTRPGLPGTTGTPAAIMVALAVFLSPIRFIMSAVGPMNLIPADAQTSANSAFSARNP